MAAETEEKGTLDMPDTAIVVISVVASFFTALTVTVANNRLQQSRDEQRLTREKGESIIFKINRLTALYVTKYNFANACRHSGIEQNLNDTLGPETELSKLMNVYEEEINAATQIYFPSCDIERTEWRKALGRADACYGIDAVTNLLATGNSLGTAVAREIELIRSASAYKRWRTKLRNFFPTQQ